MNDTFLIVIPCLLFNQFPFAFTYSYIGNFNSKICFLVHLFCLHFFFFLQQACATNFVSGCNWHTVDRNYHEDYAAYCLHVIDVAGFFDHFRHWAVPSFRSSSQLMAAVTEQYFACTNSVHIATREVGFMPPDWMIITGISFISISCTPSFSGRVLGASWFDLEDSDPIIWSISSLLYWHRGS